MTPLRSAFAGAAVGLLLLAVPASGQPAPETARRLVEAAEAQIGVTTRYDPSYVGLAYPGGDVPADRGVCTDVVVRAFRALGVDLQVEVHEDMAQHFAAYPRKWGLRGPDKNIDHRRVPNLMTYFERRGKSQPLDGDYRPGDVVAWRLPSGQGHIGIVSGDPVSGTGRTLVIHNLGRGTVAEDVLHAFEIIGHYRW